MPKKKIISQNKNILIAVNSLEDAFKDCSSNTATNVIYIKTADLKEWIENKDLFVSKTFGDRKSGMSLNFIYKNGDKEFEKNNLIAKILEFKKYNF